MNRPKPDAAAGLGRARAAFLLIAALLAACAHRPGPMPGASAEEVRAVMGEPAMVLRDADGTAHLAYPTGPFGYRTTMAHIGPDGRLLGLENVLDAGHFAQVRPGMTQEQVLRLLGPPAPERTAYFAARDELAWDWRYCDDWNAAAYFTVLFDATQGTVRSTLNLREHCGWDLSACHCAH